MTEILYQIADWDHTYENAKSRTLDRKSWCAVPNKQDGLGYSRVMSQKNGTALYGAFIGVVLVASKQLRPREGYLTDTGCIRGIPLTPSDLSLLTKAPKKLIEEMLELMGSASVQWITTYDKKDTEWIPRIPQVVNRRMGRKDGKDGREGRTFSPPTPEEVEQYAKSINFDLKGEYFVDYYTSRGWKLKGGDAMKDWKATVRNWKNIRKEQGNLNLDGNEKSRWHSQ